MTPIERTAYPILNAERIIPQKKLRTSYTLTSNESQHIKNSIRTNMLRLYYALQLKTYQELGYFIEVKEVSITITAYIKKQLGIPHNFQLQPPPPTTIYRHRQSIRIYLNMTPWGMVRGEKSARRVALNAALQAAQTLTIPADIINVVIETLRRDHCELPLLVSCVAWSVIFASGLTTLFLEVFTKNYRQKIKLFY